MSATRQVCQAKSIVRYRPLCSRRIRPFLGNGIEDLIDAQALRGRPTDRGSPAAAGARFNGRALYFRPGISEPLEYRLIA